MKLDHFSYSHLPPALANVSKIFHDTAHSICNTLPSSWLRDQALMKLWEAKNLAVVAEIERSPRSALPPHPASMGAGVVVGINEPARKGP
jgi:hypothetical protein